MATNAPPTLPKVISDYLAASENRDVDAIVACFSDDGVVVDEGEQRRGVAELRRWREDVDTAFQYTAALTGWVPLGDIDGAQRYDVALHLQGDFPGGEVDLLNRFAVRDGRIVSLYIAPAAS